MNIVKAILHNACAIMVILYVIMQFVTFYAQERQSPHEFSLRLIMLLILALAIICAIGSVILLII